MVGVMVHSLKMVGVMVANNPNILGLMVGIRMVGIMVGVMAISDTTMAMELLVPTRTV